MFKDLAYNIIMLVSIFKVKSFKNNIKLLYNDFGSNVPKYLPIEGGTYTGLEYLCCVDNKVNVENMCYKHNFTYNHLVTIKIDESQYNNNYTIGFDYFSKQEPYYLFKD